MKLRDVIMVLRQHDYMSGDVDRKDMGRDEFFTPASCVRLLLKKYEGFDYEAFVDGLECCFDPTCGDGAWLVECLIARLCVMKGIGFDEVIGDEVAISEGEYVDCLSSIHGVDISFENITTARNRLLEPIGDIAKDIVHSKILQGDILNISRRLDEQTDEDRKNLKNLFSGMEWKSLWKETATKLLI